MKASGSSLGGIDADGFCAMDRDSLDAIWAKTYPDEAEARETAVLADLLAARRPGRRGMSRVARVMRLKRSLAEEYHRRHDELWPEMARTLKEAGSSDYTIFLDPESLELFAVQTRSEDSTADELPRSAVVRRWWDYMKDIMETNPDASPKTRELVEVFHLD